MDVESYANISYGQFVFSKIHAPTIFPEDLHIEMNIDWLLNLPLVWHMHTIEGIQTNPPKATPPRNKGLMNKHQLFRNNGNQRG